MEALLRPDTGLMIWTVFTFAVLVGLLGAFAWKPVINALEEREKRLHAEREAAEQARQAAEKIRVELDERLQVIREESQATVEAAFAEGAKERDAMIEEARESAKNLLEKARSELEHEKRRLVAELRQEVAGLSLMAAEKVLGRKMDAAAHKDLFEDFLKEMNLTSTK